MKIKSGYLYFISDDFFKLVSDEYLKINYNTTKRPHYLTFLDKSTNLYWVVPCSTKTDKFEQIIEKKKKLNKPTDTIQIMKIQGKKMALLFQDMFPVTKAFISNQYQRANQPFGIFNPIIIDNLKKNAVKTIKLIRLGIKFTPTQPDALRIEKIMLDELLKERLAENQLGRPLDLVNDNGAEL